MRLYIIRHADPDYPNGTITAQGHREAAALAQRLVAERLDRLYSSPLQRALDTARYTQDALGMTPVVEDWMAELSEWHLDQEPWKGLVAWDLPGEIIRGDEVFPSHDTWHRLSHLRDLRLEEKYETLIRDSDDFLRRHGYERAGGRYRLARPHRERIAVFCHNGLALTWLAHLLAIPLTLMWSSFWMAPSSVTTILFDERSPEWAVPRCIGFCDVSHLYAAGLPVQPRGILANFD